MENADLIAAVVSFLIALTGLIKSQSDIKKINDDRVETKASRDSDSQKIHDDVIRLQERVDTHTMQVKTLFESAAATSAMVNDMKNQLTEVITNMRTIIDALKELKDEVKVNRQ